MPCGHIEEAEVCVECGDLICDKCIGECEDCGYSHICEECLSFHKEECAGDEEDW